MAFLRGDLPCLALLYPAHRKGESALCAPGSQQRRLLRDLLHGAHVTSWQSGGHEQLFLKPPSGFSPGKTIRGGVPVIFPRFGALALGKTASPATSAGNWIPTPAAQAHAEFTLTSTDQT